MRSWNALLVIKRRKRTPATQRPGRPGDDITSPMRTIRTILLGLCCLAHAALLLAPLAGLHAANAPKPASKPNILWIIMDDVGAELPCYGEKAIQTPHVDRLVREGTKFDRAFLTASVCSPSRSAMITGMYQTSIGAHHHRSGRGVEKIHLPAGSSRCPCCSSAPGISPAMAAIPRRESGVGKTDYNFEWARTMYDSNDWAGRKPGQPFFAQIQLWGGKNRNDNGRWYRDVAPKALGTLTKPESVTLPPYYPRDPVLLQDWAAYLDCIRYCDLQLGEILKRLEAEGILEQTIIIFMGDNGISAAREKQFLYDGGIRTPFIVRGPGIPRGSVRSDLIEHIDMAATSLAWAGHRSAEDDAGTRHLCQRLPAARCRVRRARPLRRNRGPYPQRAHRAVQIHPQFPPTTSAPPAQRLQGCQADRAAAARIARPRQAERTAGTAFLLTHAPRVRNSTTCRLTRLKREPRGRSEASADARHPARPAGSLDAGDERPWSGIGEDV